VIVDTPPVTLAPDASLIASAGVDGVVFVVDTSNTKRAQLQAGLNQLAKLRARALGIVLNRVEGGDEYGYYGRATEEPASSGVAGAGDGEV
jgi:Mrp family chromosome partitioning ATPase